MDAVFNSLETAKRDKFFLTSNENSDGKTETIEVGFDAENGVLKSYTDEDFLNVSITVSPDWTFEKLDLSSYYNYS